MTPHRNYPEEPAASSSSRSIERHTAAVVSEHAAKTVKGPEYNDIVVIGQPVVASVKTVSDPGVKCCDCDTALRGGATRVCAHLLRGIGIIRCKGETPEAEPALKGQQLS